MLSQSSIGISPSLFLVLLPSPPPNTHLPSLFFLLALILRTVRGWKYCVYLTLGTALGTQSAGFVGNRPGELSVRGPGGIGVLQ